MLPPASTLPGALQSVLVSECVPCLLELVVDVCDLMLDLLYLHFPRLDLPLQLLDLKVQHELELQPQHSTAEGGGTV